MEKKLYYQDSYQKSFTAEVVKEEMDVSGRLYAVLNQTAFYPTGGGQPFDSGTLNGVQVNDVEEVDGEIRHYISGSIGKEKQVGGVIDWELRFDHMQQHSGQHILSAAFEELFHYKTLSFHLGKETLTIDIETENLSNEEAAAAEELANRIILENRPIITKWVDSEELEQYSLRKELSVTENIRLVIIPDFDYSGCGGTHPASTGQVAALKILGWERQKKKIRVEFVCGNRVLKQLGQKNSVIKQLTSLMNAPEEVMAATVQRLLEGEKELEKALEDSKQQLIEFEAAELISGSGTIVSRIYQNRSIQDLQKLARVGVTNADDRVFLLLGENEDKLQFVFARGKKASGDMKELSNRALSIINGKGGGNASLSQGGGERHMPAEEFMGKIIELAISYGQ
jgi:alanyl-tRNA synthetase